jgi:hypothetical protein
MAKSSTASAAYSFSTAPDFSRTRGKPPSGPFFLLRILIENGAAQTVHAEVFALNSEGIEMGVAPVEGKLECIVKISNSLVGANQKPAPDQRTDAAQPGMKLINRESA